MLELPVLDPCPYHGENQPDGGVAGCHICWSRFYIPFDAAPHLGRIKHQIERHEWEIKRAKQYIALRGEGFDTNNPAPKDALVVFALPDGSKVNGRNIDDICGGLYPVKDNANQTPIPSYLGWKKVEGPCDDCTPHDLGDPRCGCKCHV